MTRPDQLTGAENRVEFQVKGGTRVVAIREDGMWRLEGDMPLTRHNEFNHLKEVRDYIRSLR